MPLYEGPIIDAHHHLWDLGLRRQSWLTGADSTLASLGDIAYMRRDYLPADLFADIGPESVVATVAIEAVWDTENPVTAEADWLAALPRPAGMACRFVAGSPLRRANPEAALEALAARPVVAGIRETVRWHPNPAKSWTDRGILDDPAWRSDAARLARYGFLLELLMNPFQCDELARAAAALPDTLFVVDHCGSPLDRDPASRDRWRAGLRAIAQQPNTAIKLSNFAAYADSPTPEGRRAVIRTCLDAFGPDRTLFASDYPVGRRTIAYRDALAACRHALADLSSAEQRAVFHDNAARLYRISP